MNPIFCGLELVKILQDKFWGNKRKGNADRHGYPDSWVRDTPLCCQHNAGNGYVQRMEQ